MNFVALILLWTGHDWVENTAVASCALSLVQACSDHRVDCILQSIDDQLPGRRKRVIVDSWMGSDKSPMVLKSAIQDILRDAFTGQMCHCFGQSIFNVADDIFIVNDIDIFIELAQPLSVEC